jgi:hypothetical protein
MKFTITRNIIVVAFVAIFSQFAMADNASAQKTIAGVLNSLNHFPSDADKAALMAISEDDSVGEGYKALAGVVANISHSANAEGKAVAARIMESDMAPADLKTLAEIVANLNHMASADDKAKLMAML